MRPCALFVMIELNDYEITEDPFASDKGSEYEVNLSEDFSESMKIEDIAVNLKIPLITKNIIRVNVPKLEEEVTVESVLEALKGIEEASATFTSTGDFLGRIYYCQDKEANLTDKVEEWRSLIVINNLVNDELESENEEDEQILNEPVMSDSLVGSITKTPVEATKTSLMKRIKTFWSKSAAGSMASSSSTSSYNTTLGIKGEDLFGYHLIEDALEYLRAESQIQEGLFRLSGNFNRIQNLKESLESGHRLRDLNLTAGDCHNVTGLFKQFLRNLSVPLLTFELYEGWQAFGRLLSVPVAKFLVQMLPEPNGRALKDILGFLHARLADAEVTRMNCCNFGTVIGPNLLWHPLEDRQTRDSQTMGLSLQSSTLATQICTFLLQNYETIYADGNGEELIVYAYGKALYDYCENCVDEDEDESENENENENELDGESSDNNKSENSDNNISESISENNDNNISESISENNDNNLSEKSDDCKSNSDNLLNENDVVFICGIEDRSDGWFNGIWIKSQKSDADELTVNTRKFPSNYVKVIAQLPDNLIIKQCE